MQSTYKGTWKDDAAVGLDSVVPMAVIAYFMKNNFNDRLESMAQKAVQYKPLTVLACK
ncbi:hypothetical protein [Polynucleobacter necessarius]|uniref:hypothetical protein n=1 Tax=Polynucleobacter necessarius TaxID=576610 RepID=UPI0013B063E9|nr:hypothetical protein [Polynucleobacter necessarius]